MNDFEKISLLTKDNKIFYQGRIEKLPINEAAVEKIGFELYNNSKLSLSEKNEILSSIHSDFHKFFKKIGYSTPIPINKLPKKLSKYVNIQ